MSNTYTELVCAVEQIERLATTSNPSRSDLEYCLGVLRQFLAHPQVIATPAAYTACQAMIAKGEDVIKRLDARADASGV